jgi:putative endonuclease
MFIVYILYSSKIKKHYTGSTNDLDRRLKEHNRGKTAFTKSRIPWVLMYQKAFSTRAESVRFEESIKNRGAGRFLDENTEG